MQLAAIGGDGVGAELMAPAVELLTSCFELPFVSVDAGYGLFRRTGRSMAEEATMAIAGCDGVLFGAVASPSERVEGYESPILRLRRELELFANIRPVKKHLPGGKPVDLCIIRENLEGLYAGQESRSASGATALKVVSASRTERLARFAMAYARQHGRRRVTVVHKANVLKQSDGLFREICLEVAREFPDLDVNEQLVDSAAYWLVRDPGRFDVLLTMNLYGDILSDVAAGVADGLGFAPSLSVGSRIPLAEPVHGAAPDIAGQGIANPYGLLFSACLLMQSVGLEREATTLERALEDTISDGRLTPDVGGQCKSIDVFDAVASRCKRIS